MIKKKHAALIITFWIVNSVIKRGLYDPLVFLLSNIIS